jgi:quercetin dioxygenase-like cupin family protein
MRMFAVATLALLGLAAAPADQMEIRLENQHVRVLEYHYEPGEASPLHAHEHPRVVYVLDGGELELVAEDGTSTRIRIEPGQTSWRPPENHVVRNVGRTTIRVLETEVKARPAR